MKTTNFERLVYRYISILLIVLLSSCSEDDAYTPSNSEETGFITTENIDDNGYDLDGDDPITVSSSGSQLSFQSKSSYYDADGSIYSVSPEATINTSIELDSAVVSSLDDLTTITALTPNNSTTTEDDLSTYSTEQIFKVGPQTITFDTSYEVYTYTNSANQRIEMPYINVETPKAGNSSSEETTKSSTDAIKLVKVISTRATVTTEETYEVTATFSVAIESMNTSTEYSKNLEFEISYIGTVATDVEVDDPHNTLDYSVYNGYTNVSDTSSFDINNTSLFEIDFNQTAKYVDYLGDDLFTSNPEAQISVQATTTSVTTDSYEDLINVVTASPIVKSSGSNPLVSTTEQTFTIADQEIIFNVFDEMYSYEDVDMAYLKVNTPTLKSINATEVTTKATVTESTNYDVVAIFSVDVETINLADNYSNTYELIISYTGVVDTTITVDDPYNTLDYSVYSNGVDVSDTSSFEVNNTDLFEIDFDQTAKYVDYLGDDLFTSNPEAQISVQATTTSVTTDSYEDLINVVIGGHFGENSGSNPQVYTTEQTFIIADQEITFNVFNEMYSYEGVDMAYLKVNTPTLKSINATEVTTKATITESTNYDVVAIFSVDVETINLADNYSNTYEFIVSYTGVVDTTITVDDPYNTLDYSVYNNGVDVSDTSSFEVNNTDLFEIDFDQTAKYVDYLGDDLFTSNPKAQISVQATTTSVTTDSYDDLITVYMEVAFGENSESNPLVSTTEQTYTIADQEITFNVFNEMYSYEDVDMAYLKVNTPILKSINATEVTTKATVNESTNYDVVAIFSVDVETINLADNYSNTYEFIISYTGVVDTTITVDDPYNTLDYSVYSNGVDVSDTSSFEVNNTDLFEIDFDQTAKYIDYQGVSLNTVENNAFINIQATSSLVEIKSSDSVDINIGDTIITTQSDGSTVNNTECIFTIGEQEISINISDQMFEYDDNKMAYLKVNTPEYIGITANKTFTDADGNDNHDIVVTFNVDVESINLENNFSKTYTFNVSYTGIEVIPTVVDVSYDHYMNWVEAHDNLHFCGYATVDKTTTYSDGSTVTATYQDYGHITFISSNAAFVLRTLENGETKYEVLHAEQITDYHNTTYDATIVIKSASQKYLTEYCDPYYGEDLKERTIIIDDETLQQLIIRDYSEYTISKKYDDGATWFSSLAYIRSINYCIWYGNVIVGSIGSLFQIHDQYLYIDGQYIYFDDYKPVYNTSIVVTNIPAPAGYESAYVLVCADTVTLKDEVTYAMTSTITFYIEPEF